MKELKKIEQIAIDAIMKSVMEDSITEVSSVHSARTECDLLHQKYVVIRDELFNRIRGNFINVISELSPEGIEYIETDITQTFRSNFKLK